MQEANCEDGHSPFINSPGLMDDMQLPSTTNLQTSPMFDINFGDLSSNFNARPLEQGSNHFSNPSSYSSQPMLKSQSAAGPVVQTSFPMSQQKTQPSLRSRSSHLPSRLMIRGNSSTRTSNMPFVAATGRLPSRLSPVGSQFYQDFKMPESPAPSIGQTPSEYISSSGFTHVPMMANEFPVSPLATGLMCPSLINCDTDDEISSPMTRQSSFGADLQYGAPMSRHHSSAHDYYNHIPEGAQLSPFEIEQHWPLYFTASVQNPSPLSAEFKLERLDHGPVPPMTPASDLSADMERSGSKASGSSSGSRRSGVSRTTRNKEALARTIEVGRALQLAPKPAAAALSTALPPLPKRKMLDATAERTTPKKPRTTKRAKKDKIMCEVPGCGKMFSGAHEQQRHYNNTHQATKRFVIREPDTSDPSRIPLFYPDKPISGCEKCRKLTAYAADYNAASHLRRKHFNPRDSSNKDKEKRGGKSGGVWPLMAELKKWLVTDYFDEPAEGSESASQSEARDEESGSPADASTTDNSFASSGRSHDTTTIPGDGVDLQTAQFDNGVGATLASLRLMSTPSEEAGRYNTVGDGTIIPSKLSPDNNMAGQSCVFNIDYTSIQQAYY